MHIVMSFSKPLSIYCQGTKSLSIAITLRNHYASIFSFFIYLLTSKEEIILAHLVHACTSNISITHIPSPQCIISSNVPQNSVNFYKLHIFNFLQSCPVSDCAFCCLANQQDFIPLLPIVALMFGILRSIFCLE